MNDKKFTLLLSITGAVLLCLSLVLAVIATANRDIIGGADLPTFFYVFSRDKNGLYKTLSFIGILCIVVSVFYGKIKKRD